MWSGGQKLLNKTLCKKFFAKFAEKNNFGGHIDFWPAILTWSWWHRKLKFNTKPSHDIFYLHYEFQENRMKTMTMTVLPCFHTNMAAVTSSIMQMSQNSNKHNWTHEGPFWKSLIEFHATSGFGGHFEFSDFYRFLTGS